MKASGCKGLTLFFMLKRQWALRVYNTFAIHNWAKAQSSSLLNCHGLKPVAMVFQGI